MSQKEFSIFDIEEFSLGRKFGLLGRLYLSYLAQNLKHLGIKKHFSVLVLIDKMGNHCSQKFIADSLHIDKTMMVGVIDDLGSKGYIKRIQNPTDRREYWIQLTPKAKKHMPEIKKVVNTINKQILKELNKKEIRDFHKNLDNIYKNISHLNNSKVKYLTLAVLFVLESVFSVNAQSVSAKDSTPTYTLDQCISYALENQPSINEAFINIEIAKTANKIALSGWLPQVNVNGTLTHYFQVPYTFAPNPVVGEPPIPTRAGIDNVFNPELSATETIFEPSLIYAANTASLYVKQARLSTDSTKIYLTAAVSKAFYNLLLTLKQINILQEDTARDERSVTDTHNQYIVGIVDKTDYEEAEITLNNSLAQLRLQTENIKPQYALLKQVMGYPPNKQFNVSYDTTQMTKDLAFDTTTVLKYENRIEYQQLQNATVLQHALTNYYRFSFLPTLSAFYDYFDVCENNNFSDIFSTSYPYSYIGLTLSLPIFTGFSRVENIHKSKLQEQVLDLEQSNLQSVIYTQYASALAGYKSNAYSGQLLRDNESKAKDVYDVVSLQYRQGIVPYLNVIVAEANLISAEIGYVNALFQLQSSKIDLEKALGIIPFKPTTK
jgi:outer membrane protein TolC/DNA-binding MarR family transcriptional regulator